MKHGHSPRSGHSRTYRAWAKMKERCNNPRDKDRKYYADRQITYCNRWEKFELFLLDMGECPDKLELDRIDSNKNYSPKNCRWVTEQIQSENRNHTLWITLPDGRRVTMKEAARTLGLKYGSLKQLTSSKNGLLPRQGQAAVERLLTTRLK